MKKTQKKAATLKAIAAECGVSIMTVSRAFKSAHLLDPATRSAILTAAAKKGYQPDGRMGRPRLRGNAGRRTAQVITNMNLTAGMSLFHAYLLAVMEKAFAQREYDCLLRTYDGSYPNFVWLCELLRSSPPLPTMIVGDFPLEHLRTLLGLIPRALLVDFAENPRLSCPYNSIGFDNVEAARMAVRHLLETGRQRILLLKGDPSHFFSREIERGYREALEVKNTRTDPTLIANADFTPVGACQKTKSLIETGLEFDAVFTNDEMAFGVIKALREHGMQVPQDVAVCGCDDLPFGAFLETPLTTIKLDYAELGNAAVERLLTPSRNDTPPRRTKLVPRLEIRESTARR